MQRHEGPSPTRSGSRAGRHTPRRPVLLGVSLLALAGGGLAVGLPVAGAAGGVPAASAPAAATVPVSRVAATPTPPVRPGRTWRWSPRPRPTTPTRTTPTRTTATRTTATRTTTPRVTTPAPVPSTTTGAPGTGAPTTTGAPVTTAPPTTSTGTGAPATSTGTPGGGTTESWAGTSSTGYRLAPRGGSTVRPGVADAAASDGKALSLTVPAGAGASPDNAAEVETRAAYRYGSFSSRVRTADCAGQPATGAVTGIFTYGNDGRDHDGDGITDNNELDVEILCARPDEVNLTIWTDYRDGDEAQRRVTRVVNLRTGKIGSTCYATSFGDCRAITGAESMPATVTAVPGFNSATAYHDYRIDWSADRVVFTVTVDGREITLWDYRGPADRIPQGASSYLVNLWHTDNWSPAGLTAESAPTSPLTAWVDSSTVRAAS